MTTKYDFSITDERAERGVFHVRIESEEEIQRFDVPASRAESPDELADQIMAFARQATAGRAKIADRWDLDHSAS